MNALVDAQARRYRRHRRAGGVQSRADGDSRCFCWLPAGIPPRFSVAHLLPGYALGFLIGSLGLVWHGDESGAARRPRRCHRACLRQQRAGDHRLHALDHAAGVSADARCRTGPGQIGAAAVAWTGIIKLAAAPFAGVIRRFIPAPAAMTVFGAAMYSYLALVLLQRIFDQPLGRASSRWRLSPPACWPACPSRAGGFRRSSWPGWFRWRSALAIGYVHPVWQALAFTLPWSLDVRAAARAWGWRCRIFSVIAAHGDLSDACRTSPRWRARPPRATITTRAACWPGTAWERWSAALAGSVVSRRWSTRMHPPYKAMGARIGFALWTPVAVSAVVDERADDLDRAAVSLVDSGGDDRLCRRSAWAWRRSAAWIENT